MEEGERKGKELLLLSLVVVVAGSGGVCPTPYFRESSSGCLVHEASSLPTTVHPQMEF